MPMARNRTLKQSGVKKSGALGRLVTIVVTVGLTLGVLEALVRTMDGVAFAPRSFVADKLSLFASAYPSVYDPLLGYVPKPKFSGTANAWNTEVTIDRLSLRQNAADTPTPDPVAVLAVGDSYTFGDEVSDSETWPAQLDGLLGQPVANAGVFGYGLDQAVLRAERLVPELEPWALVVSFIYGDVRRTQLIQRTGVEKPYFDVVDGALVLRNVPPSRNRPRIEQMGVVRAALGYSYLVDWTARRLGATEWWYAGGFPQVKVHDDGPTVACLLMRRLKALEEKTGSKVLVVAQYLSRNITDLVSPKSVEELTGSERLLACAQQAGLATLDTLSSLRALYDADPAGFYSKYFLVAHMSKAGNRVVAEGVADALVELLGGE